MSDEISIVNAGIARTLAKAGWKWEEISRKLELPKTSRKKAFDLLIGRTHKEACCKCNKAVTLECLTRAKPDDIILSSDVVLSIRYSVEKGFTYREVRDRFAPHVSLKVIEHIVYNELYDWLAGPTKTRRGNKYKHLQSKEMKDIAARIKNGNLDDVAAIADLSNEEIRFYKLMLAHAKSI